MDSWYKVAMLDEIPLLGSRVIVTGQGDIALFRATESEVFALYDKCPHKGGPLSQGMVCGRTVICPLHGMNINLENGQAVAPDEGCVKTVASRVENGEVFLQC